MSRLVRWLLFQLGHEVNKEQALCVARTFCMKRGFPWNEPVKVYRHYGDWAVWTAANRRGGNVKIVVDGGTGDVKRVMGPTPR